MTIPFGVQWGTLRDRCEELLSVDREKVDEALDVVSLPESVVSRRL